MHLPKVQKGGRLLYIGPWVYVQSAVNYCRGPGQLVYSSDRLNMYSQLNGRRHE